MEPTCHRCHSPRYEATGVFNVNRFGMRRAEVRCQDCGYVWPCGLSGALAAGEVAAALLPPPHPGIPQTFPEMIEERPIARKQDTVTTEDLERRRRRKLDWKARAASQDR